MGEGDRGAGSLHFFVSALRRGGCGRSGNGSHASPGEAEAEAGSLHFFVPALRRGGCDAAEAEAVAEAPPGRAARGPDGTRKSTGEKSPRAERAATGAEAEAETEAKHRPTRETVKRPFVLPDPAQGRTSPPSEAVSQASPPRRENGGQPRKRVVRRCCIGISGLCPRGVRSAERAPEVPLRPETPGTVTGTGQGTESKGAPAACRGGAVTARPARQPSVALRGRFRPRWSPDCPTPRWSGRRRESRRRGL